MNKTINNIIINDKLLDKYYDSNMKSNIKPAELELLKMYSGGYSYLVNRYLLYKNPKYYSFKQLAVINSIIFVLKKYINLSENPINNLTIYHGTYMETLKKCLYKDGEKSYFKSKTFLSTSLSEQTALNFTNEKNDEPVLMKIILSPNQKFLWMKKYSEFPTEAEILLDSDSEINIDNINSADGMVKILAHY